MSARYEILFRDEAGLICYATRHTWRDACGVLAGRRKGDKLGVWARGAEVSPLSWRKSVSRLERTLGLFCGETKPVMQR